MRNKNRIEPFLKKLQEFWEANSDWRFGQLILNVVADINYTDIFFAEEDKWLHALDKIKTPQWNGFKEKRLNYSALTWNNDLKINN